MSATDKKNAMRGTAPSELDLSDLEEVQDFEPVEAELEEPAEDAEDEEPALPEGVTEEKNGDWICALKFPLSDGSRTPSVIRIPANIYANDVRNSTLGRTENEQIFYMIASCAKVPPKILNMVDAYDYMILSTLMNRRSLKKSLAVVKAIAGKAS